LKIGDRVIPEKWYPSHLPHLTNRVTLGGNKMGIFEKLEKQFKKRNKKEEQAKEHYKKYINIERQKQRIEILNAKINVSMRKIDDALAQEDLGTVKELQSYIFTLKNEIEREENSIDINIATWESIKDRERQNALEVLTELYPEFQLEIIKIWQETLTKLNCISDGIEKFESDQEINLGNFFRRGLKLDGVQPYLEIIAKVKPWVLLK
jgi:hypothetical protein